MIIVATFFVFLVVWSIAGERKRACLVLPPSSFSLYGLLLEKGNVHDYCCHLRRLSRLLLERGNVHD